MHWRVRLGDAGRDGKGACYRDRGAAAGWTDESEVRHSGL